MSGVPQASSFSRAALLLGCLAATQASSQPKNALGSTREDAECRPCPLPAGAVVPSEDLALIRALLWAVEPAPPEVRTVAIEDLGLLGDTRALNTLAQLSLDPNFRIASAAVRAVGLMRHPRAEEILCNIVRHPALPEALKLSALGVLPYQNTDTAFRFIAQVAKNNQLAATIQSAARLALKDLPSPSEQARP